MTNLKATAILTLSLLAFSGCGGDSAGSADSDDSGGSTDEGSTGVSTSEALTDVTTKEATQSCQQLKDAIEARFQKPTAKSGICTLLAMAGSSNESSCNNLRDSCLKGDGESFDPAQIFECSGTDVDGWHGCTATVGEMETCLTDTLDAFQARLDTYTCQDAGKPIVVTVTPDDPTQPGDQSSSMALDCSTPPLDQTGKPAIDPTTGQPYPDHRAECLSPTRQASCEALHYKCPNLELFGD